MERDLLVGIKISADRASNRRELQGVTDDVQAAYKDMTSASDRAMGVISGAFKRHQRSSRELADEITRLGGQFKDLQRFSDQTSDRFSVLSRRHADLVRELQQMQSIKLTGTPLDPRFLMEAENKTIRLAKEIESLEKGMVGLADGGKEAGDQMLKIASNIGSLSHEQEILNERVDRYGHQAHRAFNRGLHAAVTLAKGVIQIGLAGEESTTKILKNLVWLEGAANLVRGMSTSVYHLSHAWQAVVKWLEAAALAQGQLALAKGAEAAAPGVGAGVGKAVSATAAQLAAGGVAGAAGGAVAGGTTSAASGMASRLLSGAMVVGSRAAAATPFALAAAATVGHILQSRERMTDQYDAGGKKVNYGEGFFSSLTPDAFLSLNIPGADRYNRNQYYRRQDRESLYYDKYGAVQTPGATRRAEWMAGIPMGFARMHSDADVQEAYSKGYAGDPYLAAEGSRRKLERMEISYGRSHAATQGRIINQMRGYEYDHRSDEALLQERMDSATTDAMTGAYDPNYGGDVYRRQKRITGAQLSVMQKEYSGATRRLDEIKSDAEQGRGFNPSEIKDLVSKQQRAFETTSRLLEKQMSELRRHSEQELASKRQVADAARQELESVKESARNRRDAVSGARGAWAAMDPSARAMTANAVTNLMNLQQGSSLSAVDRDMISGNPSLMSSTRIRNALRRSDRALTDADPNFALFADPLTDARDRARVPQGARSEISRGLGGLDYLSRRVSGVGFVRDAAYSAAALIDPVGTARRASSRLEAEIQVQITKDDRLSEALQEQLDDFSTKFYKQAAETIALALKAQELEDDVKRGAEERARAEAEARDANRGVGNGGNFGGH